MMQFSNEELERIEAEYLERSEQKDFGINILELFDQLHKAFENYVAMYGSVEWKNGFMEGYAAALKAKGE